MTTDDPMRRRCCHLTLDIPTQLHMRQKVGQLRTHPTRRPSAALLRHLRTTSEVGGVRSVTLTWER
jgi:hypothetical protein